MESKGKTEAELRQAAAIVRQVPHHVKEHRPPLLPFQVRAEIPHGGQHPEQPLANQLLHGSVKPVLLHGHAVHGVFAYVPAVFRRRASPLAGPDLFQRPPQHRYLAVFSQINQKLRLYRRHRLMVRHLPVGAQGLDGLRVRAAPAVLAEQQPGQAVVNAALPRGVVPVNAGLPPAEVDGQAFVALEIFQRQLLNSDILHLTFPSFSAIIALFIFPMPSPELASPAAAFFLAYHARLYA